jgi:hypothetical protein
MSGSYEGWKARLAFATPARSRQRIKLPNRQTFHSGPAGLGMGPDDIPNGFASIRM